MYDFYLYPKQALCSSLSLAFLSEALENYLLNRVHKAYMLYTENERLCIQVEDYHFYLKIDESPAVSLDFRDYLKRTKGLGYFDPFIDYGRFEKSPLRLEFYGEEDGLKEYVEECLLIIEYFAHTKDYIMVPVGF